MPAKNRGHGPLPQIITSHPGRYRHLAAKVDEPVLKIMNRLLPIALSQNSIHTMNCM